MLDVEISNTAVISNSACVVMVRFLVSAPCGG